MNEKEKVNNASDETKFDSINYDNNQTPHDENNNESYEFTSDAIPEEKGKSKDAAKNSIIGAGGVLLGGAAALGFMAFREANVQTPHPEPPHPIPPVPEPDHFNIDDIKIAESPKDDMSFSEAFATARAEVGPHGVFEWRGGVYGTYYDSEWNNFSKDYKDAFANADWRTEFKDRGLGDRFEDHLTHQEEIHETFGDHEIHRDTDGHEYIVLTDAATGEEVHISPEDMKYAILDNNGNLIGIIGEGHDEYLTGINGGDDNIEVAQLSPHIINIDGHDVSVVEAVVDGHETIFVDTDSNGTYETAVVNTGDPDNPEIYHHETGFTLDELSEHLKVDSHHDLEATNGIDYAHDFDNHGDIDYTHDFDNHGDIDQFA